MTSSGKATPASQSPQLYMVRPGPWNTFWGVLQRAFVSAYEDNCFGIAKGAAYSALLSFFPVLASIAATLVRVRAESVSRVISRMLFVVAPPGTEQLIEYSFAVKGQRPVWLFVAAIVLSIWAASGAMMSLMEGFQAAYKLPTGRPFVQQRSVAALLVLCAALPFVGASWLILFGRRAEKTLVSWIGVAPQELDLKSWVLALSSVSRYLLALGAIVLASALLFYLGPNRPAKRLRAVWPGAFLATVLWLATTMVFGWYVRNIANYNVLYGSIGAVIAMLVWMYLLALIALVGCEFNAERERLLGDGEGR